MKNKENESNKKDDKETFLRIFDNLKRCKALDWIERVILSNHISYQIHGKKFYQTDAFQAKELGLSAAQISKYTSRLKEREEIETKMDYVENPNGGRPIPKRYVTVIDMDKWIKGDAVPVVKKITSPTKKKMAKKIDELKKENNVEVSNSATIDTLSISATKEPYTTHSTKQKTKKDKSLKENTNMNNENILTLDHDKDIISTTGFGKAIIAEIKSGKEIEFQKVKVKLGDNDIVMDEATLLPNGLNKYFLKSTLKLIDANIFSEMV